MKRPLRAVLRLVLAAMLACVAAQVGSAAPPIDGAANPHVRAPVIVSYRDAVARASPSVVTVHSAHTSRRPLSLSSEVVTGLGSGVVIDSEGYVITNYHVVKDASELGVSLADGSLQLARVIGADADSDLALLKIDASGLQPIELADMNDVAAGDVVLAVGNPLGVGQTVTQGIVGAIVRRGMTPVENFIQTDAAINPGNSGGALIDTAGRLVGINTAILSHSGGNEGIGFAIPVDYVQTVASALKTKGRVARAWLGVATTQPASGKGALVTAVQSNGPADRGGIVVGDVIAKIGDKTVVHPQDARSVVIGADPGTHVAIEIVRGGKRESKDVELAPLPKQEPQ